MRDAIIPRAGSPKEAGFPISQWEPYRILHFACHGEFDAEHPFASARLLGRDKVSASELFAVNLNATVAILGACNLGRATGDEGSGDEWAHT